MSAIANFLRALVVDSRSQRAMDETLADASAEFQHASSVAACVWAAARAIAAVARVCLFSLGRETRHLYLGRVVLVVGATLIVPVGVTALSFPAQAGLPPTISTGSRVTLFALLTVGPVVAFFPISAFVVGVGAARWRASLLGLAVVLLAVEVALVGWVKPEAFQQYRQSIYNVHWTPAMAREIPRGVAELPLPQLVRAAQTSQGRQAGQQLYVGATLCAATMWFTLLGYGAIRLSRRARILWATAAVLTIVSIGYFRFADFTLLIAVALAVTLAIVRAHRDRAPA